MLEIKQLTFSYGKQPLLEDLSFSLKKGEIGVLIGASGSGKTTLFNLLTGMLKPQKGSIQLGGNFAYMMQKDMLLPWRSVIKNLTLLSELGSKSQAPLLRESLGLLHQMGLSSCENLYPEELSGGMRQRVSLAQALLLKRPVLLLDEPFGSLDVITREQLYLLLQEIRNTEGITILMVTHDFRDAIALADKVFLLNRGKVEKDWKITSEMRQEPHMSHHLLREMSIGLTKSFTKSEGAKFFA